MKVSIAASIKAGTLAALIAAVVNVILYYIFHTVGIITDEIEIQPGSPMTPLPIVLSSVIPALVGSIIFFLIEKNTGKGFLIFSIIAIVLGLLSLASPFMGIEGVTIAYAVVLDLMHIVVVVALLFFIRMEVRRAARR